VKADADFWVTRIGLQCIEHDFGEGVFECGAVAGQNDGGAAGFVFKLGGLDRLIFAGFLERLFDKRGEGEGVCCEQSVTSEEAHLIDEAGDAFDTIGQGSIERGAKFRVFPFVGEQLLVSGERDHGIADFVGEANQPWF